MKKIISLFLALCMMLLALPVLAETAAGTETQAETSGGLGSLLNLLGSMGEDGEENTGDAEGLGSLMGLLGGLGGDGENTGDTEGLGSLMGLLGGLGGDGESTGGAEGLGSLMSLLGGGSDSEATDSAGLGSLLSLFGGQAENGEAQEAGTSEASSAGFDLSAILGQLGITAAKEETYVAAESIDQFFGTWQLSKAVVAGYEMSLESLKALELELTVALTVSAESIKMQTTGSEPVTVAISDCALADGILNLKLDGENAKMRLTESGELCFSLEKIESEGFEMHFVRAE